MPRIGSGGHAGDGEEALRILEGRTPGFDLVVSDVVLPKLGGLDLYRQARERGLVVPFLFGSGYAPRQALGHLETDPAIRFLRKPWTIEELRVSVRASLDA